MHLMDKENNGYCIIGLQMTTLAHVCFSYKTCVCVYVRAHKLGEKPEKKWRFLCI